MSSDQFTVVLIVAIVMIASVVRAIYGVSRHSGRRLRHGATRRCRRGTRPRQPACARRSGC